MELIRKSYSICHYENEKIGMSCLKGLRPSTIGNYKGYNAKQAMNKAFSLFARRQNNNIIGIKYKINIIERKTKEKYYFECERIKLENPKNIIICGKEIQYNYKNKIFFLGDGTL